MLSERLTVFTPLGIRFWDPVMDRPVGDGLDVRAHPPTAPGQARAAFRTASGNYAFQGLPGLRGVAYPRLGESAVTSPPAPLPFVVTVADEQQRYLPAAFEVDLPLPYRGLYQIGPAGSPPAAALPGFYLFSAPTRAVSPGFGAIRAQLRDAEAGTPAAYAVVVAQFGEDGAWYGMSDSRGGLLILFPYPAFRQILHSSPPGSPPAPAGPQRWPVTLRVLYDPAGRAALPGTDLPDFRSISAQGEGLIWPDETGPPLAQLEDEVLFSQELLVRTQGLSVLLISALASLS